MTIAKPQTRRPRMTDEEWQTRDTALRAAKIALRQLADPNTPPEDRQPAVDLVISVLLLDDFEIVDRRFEAEVVWNAHRARAKSITVKFAAPCAGCGEEIPAGSSAVWAPRVGLAHLACEDALIAKSVKRADGQAA